MEINIIAFGQLAEIAGKSSWIMTGIHDTDQLKQAIESAYPAAGNIKYRMAINKKIIDQITALPAHCTVALLPPFSGG